MWKCEQSSHPLKTVKNGSLRFTAVPTCLDRSTEVSVKIAPHTNK